jgi:hypothetical protein
MAFEGESIEQQLYIENLELYLEERPRGVRVGHC